MTRVAVVDMGTNSTRLLVADVEGGRVQEVERRTNVTRLGRGVDLSGRLSSEAVEEVCETIRAYVELYEGLGAEEIVAIATSAVRDAVNGDAFIAELRERFALSARVIDGAEEARLTYLGATWDRNGNAPTLIVDIGGGSTELVVGAGESVLLDASIQAGTIRHTERHLREDPPLASSLEALAADVEVLISAAVGDTELGVREGIAVAGTPTSLAAIDLELEPYDPERVHGHRLSLERIQFLLSRLAALPLSERLEVTGLHPGRAPTIVAGVVILIEAMRAFELAEIEVSEHDILYGAARDAV